MNVAAAQGAGLREEKTIGLGECSGGADLKPSGEIMQAKHCSNVGQCEICGQVLQRNHKPKLSTTVGVPRGNQAKHENLVYNSQGYRVRRHRRTEAGKKLGARCVGSVIRVRWINPYSGKL